MKLKTLFTALLVLILASCDTKESKYIISWDLKTISESGMNIDSVNIVVGDETLMSIKDIQDNMLSAEGVISEPSIASLVLYASIEGEQQSANCDIILEAGDITIDNEYGCATGTPLNDAVLTLYKDIVDESQSPDVNLEKITDMFRTYITDHKDDVSSVYVLNTSGMFTTLEDSIVTEFYNILSKKMQQEPMALQVINKVKAKSKTTEGEKFTDFAVEYDGTTTRLSDYVGKGKYVLVDFWASWCGPCRREIPNLIKIYKKYAGDNLEVLGIASWDKPEDTQKAIEELGIKYPQIINAQSIGTDAYSIDGIPEIILFAPDGTILKRGLRGEDIETAVKEALR